LPKNVVLLSLIEATELATEDAASKQEASPRVPRKTVAIGGGMDDSDAGYSAGEEPSLSGLVSAEELEEERIKLGTSMAVSVAGTYAVTDPNGLPIFASRPSRTRKPDEAFGKDSSSKQTSDEDVDKLVRYFHLDHKMDADSTDDDLKENRVKEQTPGHLSCGDRVQVVAIEGRWAKLARGYGYVFADDHKLVKGMSLLSFHLICHFMLLYL